MELTRVGINNTQLYSFAFEAFGKSSERQIENLKIVADFVLRQTDLKKKLPIEKSFGYPTLLSTVINK